VQGNGHSASFEGAAMSGDGNIVIFASDATNLVAGDTNASLDIFAHDRSTGTTTLVSRDSGGTIGNNNSFSFSVSADGRYVAFRSSSTNLVAGDTNGVSDVFLHDRTTGTTTRVSVATGGGQTTPFSDHPNISANGLFVAFDTDDATLVAGDTNGFTDSFVRDVTNSTTTRVSLTNAGGQANGESRNPKLSADGRYVAFDSNAPDLVAGDTNISQDVFVRDRTGATTVRVSLSTGGAQGNGNSNTPSISSDGDRILFQSSAATLVTPDTNGFLDVFLHVRSTGQTTIVSRNLNGTESDDLSTEPLISPNGLVGLFRTAATNIVAGDTNGFADVFGLFGLP
jgi:Tol biopolymer transport system component